MVKNGFNFSPKKATDDAESLTIYHKINEDERHHSSDGSYNHSFHYLRPRSKHVSVVRMECQWLKTVSTLAPKKLLMMQCTNLFLKRDSL